VLQPPATALMKSPEGLPRVERHRQPAGGDGCQRPHERRCGAREREGIKGAIQRSARPTAISDAPRGSAPRRQPDAQMPMTTRGAFYQGVLSARKQSLVLWPCSAPELVRCSTDVGSRGNVASVELRSSPKVGTPLGFSRRHCLQAERNLKFGQSTVPQACDFMWIRRTQKKQRLSFADLCSLPGLKPPFTRYLVTDRLSLGS